MEWRYLQDWLGMNIIGSLESKPGIPPSISDLAELKQRLADKPVYAILRKPSDSERPSQWLNRETGVPALMLPYTVGAAGVDDLFSLFQNTLNQLLVVE